MSLRVRGRRLGDPRCRDKSEEDAQSGSGEKSPRKHWLACPVRHDLSAFCHPKETDKSQYKTRTDQFQAAIRAYYRKVRAVHRLHHTSRDLVVGEKVRRKRRWTSAGATRARKLVRCTLWQSKSVASQ
jgi:hypothetical protein